MAQPSWDTPGRLWSLWDIMNSFDASILSYLLLEIAKYEGYTSFGRLSANPTIPPNYLAEIKERIRQTEVFLGLAGFDDASIRAVKAAAHYFAQPLIDASAAQVTLNRLKTDITNALETRNFVVIQPDRAGLLDQESGFGQSVFDAFPSARRDIKEALNCLAVECTTAAVFHLMRAAEFGLRAVARDRKVEFSDKPLDAKEWGQILPNLDSKIKALRDRTAKDWPSHELREGQIGFFSEVTQELRSFNDVWRRHVSHADTQAFYDREQASSARTHVTKLLQKLATKISESTTTAEIWTT